MKSPIITYDWMDESDLDRVAEIDRSEHIVKAYVQSGQDLVTEEVDWQVPNWLEEGESDHSIYHINSFCSDHLSRGGIMLGAFAQERLAGVGLMQPKLLPSLAQLAFLQVSSSFRRLGIASRLTNDLAKEAEKRGANQIYVSATPTESAVGFYLRHGFRPTVEPIPELLALEPEDIHMIKRLHQE